MVFLVRGRGAENIEKRRKQTEEKYWKMKRKKNEEYKESQIATINIFGFTFYRKNYILLESIIEKSSLCQYILFTVFMRCRMFET